jgi:hypothetical protein
MTRACWPAAPDGRYVLDIALGTMPCRLMLDTGLVDRAGHVGFEIDPALFGVLEQSGQLLRTGRRPRSDSSGRSVWLEAGFVAARLLDPSSGSPIGPAVRCLAVRNIPGVISRVGVVFFHRLTGCRVDWDLDTREWCVECP